MSKKFPLGEEEWSDDQESSDNENDMFEDDFEASSDTEPPLTKEEQDGLYDDLADDNDEKWTSENLEKHMDKSKRNTDARLHCPGCFTLVCSDCQRHEVYPEQFRAMFIRNCKINKDEDLRYRKNEVLSNKQKKKLQFKEKMQQKKNPNSETPIPEPSPKEPEEAPASPFEVADNIYYEDEHLYEPEIYHAVLCNVCDTPLGVIDPDEIVHFYHIIPAEA